MRRVPVLLAVLGTVLTAACDVASGPSADPLFSRQITFNEFEQTLTAGVARLEIELLPLTPTGPAVAREVEVQGADERQEEESIESNALRFENLDLSACRGTLVLAPGFLVRFDGATTEFEAQEHQDLTCAQFVERVQTALASGSKPVVEAERDPAAQPQAPDDASFEARELKLEDDDGSDAPKLELNVDADNLLACSTLSAAPAGCIAVLKVLSVSIALVEGETEFESELENDMEEAEFEAIVTAVHREGSSCRLGRVTLDGGTIVELVQATEIEDESGDDEQLNDLCEVETALAAGAVVEAEGEGLLADTDPRTIVAAKVEFETEEDREEGL